METKPLKDWTLAEVLEECRSHENSYEACKECVFWSFDANDCKFNLDFDWIEGNR